MTITAKVICDSISPDNIRLTTLQIRYPRFIHSEFMTHRVFSRNASSSRAVPVEKLIEDIKRDTAMPIFWGKNQSGMQAREECNNEVVLDAWWEKEKTNYAREGAWIKARDEAVRLAIAFHKAGYHKQIVNRLLEPFSHINVVCTSAEWDNFFKLRDHPDAQPEIQELAKQMKKAMEESTPKYKGYGDWHLPYIEPVEKQNVWADIEVLIKCSVARCARVSYVTHDFKKPKIEDDLNLYDRLVVAFPPHLSPSEHQATPDKYLFESHNIWMHPEEHGNLRGWRQFRKLIEND